MPPPRRRWRSSMTLWLSGTGRARMRSAKRIRITDAGGPAIEVVGIAATSEYGFAGEVRQSAIYFPYRQRPRGQMVLLTETRGDSASLLDPLRDLVHRLDVNVPVFDVQTMESFYEARVTGIGGVM